MSIYNNITELIGQTPIVKLNNIVPEGAADVYIKLEAFNPGSSVKDRIALSMIEKAEQDGILKLGSTIVEATSGNTGIGLSWVGAAKGYKVVIVMPETMSVERRKIIQAYGAELVLTPGSEGMKGAIAKAQEIAAERDGFLPLQFDNPANPEVHERTTGAEILAAFGKDGLDAFVAGVGTGGTISGVSHALKSENSNIQVFAVEADESAILSGEKPGPHKIQGISAGFIPDTLDTKAYEGISAGFIPDTLDTKAYDGIVRVTSDDALALGREIGGKEGFLVGISSAAAIYGAIEVAKKLGTGKKVLALAPDNGERYLSTALYEL
ncbi:TPA: PLP-dependent cysteine synthase family protein [Streptococcus pneumoniae]